jgi:hypothetical protein
MVVLVHDGLECILERLAQILLEDGEILGIVTNQLTGLNLNLFLTAVSAVDFDQQVKLFY